ncbi:MAG TPA: hypothetical protein VFF26_02870, partial [Gallionella sp.]|nr:hypothetical protein [Gallionella sp.]
HPKLPKNQAPTLVGCLFKLLKSSCRGSEEVRIIVTKNSLSTLISNFFSPSPTYQQETLNPGCGDRI